MAGEIGEPFSFSSQGDGGSISFGRFETESLCWERRSSFSHNRYIEEVERCLKPGSVTEKKAFLEAHFKRKGLLSPTPSRSPNALQCSSTAQKSLDYPQASEDIHEDSNSIQFDQSFDGSECDEGSGMMEVGEGDDSVGNLDVEGHFQSALIEASFARESGVGNAHSWEENHNVSGEDTKKILDLGAINADSTSKRAQQSADSYSSSKDGNSDSLEQRRWTSLVVGAKVKSELADAKMKSPPRAITDWKKMSKDSSKGLANKPVRSLSKGSRQTRTEKHSSSETSSTAGSICRTPKPEVDSRSSKSKLVRENRSPKELKTKNVVEVKPSASAKIFPEVCQTQNSLKMSGNSTEPGMKNRSAAFNFRIDERATKRKEFFKKMEEKMHAKEVQINHFQAKELEKTEAETKQFRRSLNFKAKPMPSFYRDAVPHGLDGNKVISSSTKPNKPESKSLNTRSGVGGRSPSYQKSTNIVAGQKKYHVKDNTMDLQRRQTGGKSKATKGEKVEVKHYVVGLKSNNAMQRKDREGSLPFGTGHLAVGVVS